MKKTFLLLLIVAFSVTVIAQTSEKKWGLGGGAGAYGTLENGGIGIIPELYFSRFISPRFDLKLQGNLGVFRTTIDSDGDFANLLLNLRYKLSDETRNFRPYLYAGPGLLADDNEKGINFDLGLGFKYYLRPGWAAYFEVGYIHGMENSTGGSGPYDNFWKNTAGFELNFGKSKDSDMDGVSDKKDKCPDTPAGVAVDADGCPLDTDGDGVADYKDDCPTVAGLTSLKGCPDADGDGVADSKDKCPNTPKGSKVGADGCPIDQDKDGVADASDKCPNTPAGVAVDKDGCPIDTDRDGTPDYMDDCPTVAGPKDNKGCPIDELNQRTITPDQIELQDIKVASIHFVSGKSYLTEYSQGILVKLIKLLNENKDYNVNIFGYTDSQGSDESNLKLSEERIASTTKYLESKGISANRIIKQNAFGEAKPVASNATPEGRLLNRRVEFEIFKMK
jgi:outer membrane protein OmpA-like peptidoglycan-associated protein